MVKYFLVSIMIVFLQIPLPILPPIPSPTPIGKSTPTATPVEEGLLSSLENVANTALAQVASLPNSLSDPGGVDLLPENNFNTMFAYGKWLLSGTASREILGVTFAPVADRVYVYFAVIIFLEGLYLILNPISLMLRGLPWLLQFGLRIFLGR